MLMTRTQGWVIGSFLGGGSFWNTMFFLLYLVTIASMVYVSLCDPGLMNDDLFRRVQSDETPIPQRAFKHWLYRRPILRFHQYCRWVTNCIGLRNHREYMIMLA